MIFQTTKLKGVFEIQLEPKGDERGFFMRTYDKKIFEEHGLPTEWMQESHAFSKSKGTIRGLHFLYPPNAEAKLIRMAQGEAFWVFLDLRKGSPTLGKWGSIILSAEKRNMLFIPRGVANGVYTLSDDCHVLYKMDNFYGQNAEGGVQWDDPDLAVVWPMKHPNVLSERDKHLPSFKEFLEKTSGGLDIS